MLYELINPSDQTTFETDDFEAAVLATVVVGGGQYAAEPLDEGGEKVPLFLFGGFGEWATKRFGDEVAGAANEPDALKAWIERKREPLIKCLRSFAYGDRNTRRLYDDALEAIDDPAKRKAFIEKWNDTHRSSMNNIMGRAHAWADRLEAANADA